jgi:hypothetical protein
MPNICICQHCVSFLRSIKDGCENVFGLMIYVTAIVDCTLAIVLKKFDSVKRSPKIRKRNELTFDLEDGKLTDNARTHHHPLEDTNVCIFLCCFVRIACAMVDWMMWTIKGGFSSE